MASRRVLPHTVTLYNYLGEDSDGQASYVTTVLRGVNAQVIRGTSRTGGNAATGGQETPADSLKVFFFIHRSHAESVGGRRKKSVKPEAWVDGFPNRNPADAWTFREDGRDIMTLGQDEPMKDRKPPPGKDWFKVRAVHDHARIGSPSVRHYMIEGK